MSMEDYMTQESEAKGLTIKVTSRLDIQGYSEEVAGKVDEKLFHAVALRKGYVKERTCRVVLNENRHAVCSECGGTMLAAWVACPTCGAKVVPA